MATRALLLLVVCLALAHGHIHGKSGHDDHHHRHHDQQRLERQRQQRQQRADVLTLDAPADSGSHHGEWRADKRAAAEVKRTRAAFDAAAVAADAADAPERFSGDAAVLASSAAVDLLLPAAGDDGGARSVLVQRRAAAAHEEARQQHRQRVLAHLRAHEASLRTSLDRRAASEMETLRPRVLDLFDHAVVVLLNEDFNVSGAPPGWDNVDLRRPHPVADAFRDLWFFHNPAQRLRTHAASSLGPIAEPFAVFDSDWTYSAGFEAEDSALVSPPLTGSVLVDWREEVVHLAFDFSYEQTPAPHDSRISVEVFGGIEPAWHEVWAKPDSCEVCHAVIDISPQLRTTSVAHPGRIRFRWQGNNGLWWIVDNVKIYAIAKSTLAAAVA